MSDFDEFDSFEDFDNLEDFDIDDLDEDFADADEDILDAFEDEESVPAGPSPAEIDRRLDDYEKKTTEYRKRIVKPKQFDKKQREEALEWLGESGNPLAIPEIVKVYRKDKTPGMKEKAAYALGQFKALSQQLNDPETEAEASNRIYNMVVNDNYGKKASALPMILLEIFLVILALVLFAVGAMLNAQAAEQRAEDRSATQTAMPTPTEDTLDALGNDLNAYYSALVTDSIMMQQDLNQVGRGNAMACESLENPRAYTLSSLWETDYTDVVTALNDARTELNTVRTPYNEACSSEFISADDANSLLSTLSAIQQSFRDINTSLNTAGIEVTEPVIATLPPPATATPDPSIPTATIDTSDIDNVILDLERLILDMTDLQGATTQIAFYWQQVVDNGELYLGGCNQVPPIVPEDYVLDASLEGRSSDLETAIGNINIALNLTRDSVNAFYAACEAGEVPENPAGQLTVTQFALDVFGTAQSDLLNAQR